MEQDESVVEFLPGPQAWAGPTSRTEFGAHLGANYQRLVAQLYAMTLNPPEAHELVQEAYAQAWREWPTIRTMDDPTSWVRSYAVRASDRGWRRVRTRLGLNRMAEVPDDSVPGGWPSAILLGALKEMPSRARRCVVLRHMAGLTGAEIAALERVPESVVQARLAHGRDIVMDALAQPADGDAVPDGEYA